MINWLQPDWMLEPATMTFQWRSVQRRPALAVEIARVDHSAWQLFAPFHHLSNELHKAANCFVLFVEGRPASFAGILHRPHPRVENVKGVSRVVTLPDYQGLGLAFVLLDALGAAYRALGFRFHHYPAHPAFVRAVDRSPRWALRKKPGKFSPALGYNSAIRAAMTKKNREGVLRGGFGGRPCAVLEYVGPAMTSIAEACALIESSARSSGKAVGDVEQMGSAYERERSSEAMRVLENKPKRTLEKSVAGIGNDIDERDAADNGAERQIALDAQTVAPFNGFDLRVMPARGRVN